VASTYRRRSASCPTGKVNKGDMAHLAAGARSCGPDVDQGQSERRRLNDRDALTCWVGWWACQDLNLGPHPYQQNAGNRCAKRRSRRSRSTVEAEVMCSRGVQLCALVVRLASVAGQHRTQLVSMTGAYLMLGSRRPADLTPPFESVLAHEPAGWRSQTRHAPSGTCQGRIRQPLALRPLAPRGATAFCGPGGGNTKSMMARSP
jgi:hypothetical protein